MQDEPPAPLGNERTDVFQPPPRAAVGATPAPPRPAPQITQIVGRAAFPLYVLAASSGEFIPVLLRESTVPAGNSRQASLFALQYRIPAQRGGGVVIVLSAPPATLKTPPRHDLDDSLDAVRIDSRLSAVNNALPADPLADPGAALRRLGCPSHEAVMVTVLGAAHSADLVSWPGAPRLYLLRTESVGGEITIETGLLARKALLSLPGRLIDLRGSSEMVAALQAVFSSQPQRPTRTPTPVPSRRTAISSPAH